MADHDQTTNITVAARVIAAAIPGAKRGKWRTGHRLELGPLTVEDTSLACARRRASEALAEWLDAGTTPIVVTRAGWTVIVYATPAADGIRWTTQQVSGPDATRTSSGWGSRGGTRAEALTSVRRHVAECSTDSHDPAAVEAAVEWLRREGEGDQMVDDFLRGCAWQRAAQWANTHPDEIDQPDWHRWASEHQRDFLDRWPATETTTEGAAA